MPQSPYHLVTGPEDALGFAPVNTAGGQRRRLSRPRAPRREAQPQLSFHVASSSEDTDGEDEEQELRRELRVCHRELLVSEEEMSEVREADRRAAALYGERRAGADVRLDEMESALLSEHEEQVQERREAELLLVAARSQAAEMQTEVLLCQAEMELLDSEVHAGGHDVQKLSAGWRRAVREELLLAEEVESLRLGLRFMEQELSSRREERKRLERRRSQLEDSLGSAAQQIRSYEEWSHGVHAELREVVVELEADQAGALQKREMLEERVADLQEQAELAAELAHSGADGAAAVEEEAWSRGPMSAMLGGEGELVSPRLSVTFMDHPPEEECVESDIPEDPQQEAPSELLGRAVAAAAVLEGFGHDCGRRRELHTDVRQVRQEVELPPGALWCRKLPARPPHFPSASAPSLA